MKWLSWLCLILLAVVPALGSPAVHYAIAIHGGAGVVPKDTPAEEVEAYRSGLTRALQAGQAVLEKGGASLDAVEAAVRIMEDDPNFNAGKGAVFNHEGVCELDASIMDGRTMGCGAVAGVKTVKNPISLARLVMEKTPHVLLAGEGADAFAAQMKVEQVPQSYFFTQKRYNQWKEALKTEKIERDHDSHGYLPRERGTVGCVALDSHGNLAAATSTGGLTNKRSGRLGDSPIIGAGTYADNHTCAVSCTGTGEEFIRNAVAFQISACMEYGHMSLDDAVKKVLRGKLKPDDGGLIAVDRNGHIVMDTTTGGMFRGAASSEGRFEVKIWE